MKNPFKETKTRLGTLIREFSTSVDNEELTWHRDERDRLVTVIESSGWKFQIDNNLPSEMKPGDAIYIPALEWHRIIKGEGSLIVEISEKESSQHPKQYKAPEGSERDKMLDTTKKDLEKAKELRKQGKSQEAKELEQRAYARRDRMEKKEREKNSDVKEEVFQNSISLLKDFITEVLYEESKTSISKSTEKSIEAKAKKMGFTPSSAKEEFRKGLGAYYSSGSRPGMTPQQWAWARLNDAMKDPSQSWVTLKRSKKRK